MDNALRQIELEDVVIYKDNQYSSFERTKYLELHKKLMKEGKIKTEYKETKWICSNGIKQFEIDFYFNRYEYKKHIGKEFGITADTMTEMLKCYALFICGEFIFRTISNRVNGIKTFLTRFGDEGLEITMHEMAGILDFLGYIGTPAHQIGEIERQVRTKELPKASPRELANLINYMTIANEISDMYSSSGISDKEFIRWFPVFFWSQITFVLPLRATEMLVTPYDCIEWRYGEVYLKIRRSMLKKGKRNVYYDVDKDYRIFEYRFPDSWVIKTIEKYQDLTRNHKRRFLFDHSELSVNGILSLPSFNLMLSEFVSEKLIGNGKYAYARYAAGIEEFELVSAGDSRPIAMSNLYYQDAGADICRQLADHIHLSTSQGYYQNVGNTVLASSIMQYQRMINRGYDSVNEYEEIYQGLPQVSSWSSCSSVYRPKETGNISDCVTEDHLYECFGCRYYRPSETELSEVLDERKKELDAASKAVIDCMSDMTGKRSEDFEKIFLDAHTGITRYKTVCDEKAKEAVKKWRRHRPIVTIS
ncbi:MAG: hypothetical protein IJO13_05750 [Lachnospiraceae bacterium]|nr:hypothetical protein [Lachnospiraceae bacterium]